jgi:hypothetical protein
MPLSPSRVLRQFRYAMFFDGVDDYVFIVNSEGFPHVLKPLNGTAMAWVMWSTWQIPFLGVDPLRNTFTVGYTLARADPGWIYNVHIFDSDNQWKDIARNIPIPLNVFHHVAMRWVSGQAGWWFLNTELKGTGAIKTINYIDPSFGRSLGVYIGRDYWNYARVFISNVLIYSRALSDSEILFNYNNPDNPIRNGLVLWLQADPSYIRDVDGDGVLEWIDLSGYGNHGKIYGARLVELIKTPTRTITVARTLATVR